MQVYFRMLDALLAEQKMPDEYSNQTQVHLSLIILYCYTYAKHQLIVFRLTQNIIIVGLGAGNTM